MNLVLATAVTALQLALGSRANWEMTRQLGVNGHELKSAGTVECVIGSGIVWRVSSPFESTVIMTPDSMVFTDEDGTRVKPLAELPYYSDIRTKTDAFAAGEVQAFDGLFDLDECATPDGGWKLKLTPAIAAMKRLFTEIELQGATLPTNAVLKTADGGSCRIRFTARP